MNKQDEGLQVSSLTPENIPSPGERRYQQMIAEVEDYAIILLDANGIVLHWNAGAQKIKGYRAEEIIGKSFKLFYEPQDRDSGLPERLLAQAAEEGRAVHEGWRVRKDGSRFWGSIVITALHGEVGDLIGFSKVTRDLSDRKAAEDQIRQYAAELERQNQELKQVAYAASHDLKEPLRKIQIFNDRILSRHGIHLPEAALVDLRRSIAAASRMQKLVTDILAYSSVSHVDAKPALTDCNAIMAEVLLDYEEELTAGKMVCNYSRLPLIMSVDFLLRQLFGNLIGNAHKYRHPGRALIVNVHSSLVNLPMALSAGQKSNPYYVITFEDNGIGFEAKYNEKVFEMFQRLNTVSQYGGSGIGLSICRKIMQQHGGWIIANGSPGEGARFDLYFPAGEEIR